MGLGDFKPGSVVAAGGGSLPMGKFDSVISNVLSHHHVRNHKTLIFSNEWNKEGDVPLSPLWLFDDKPERACEDIIHVCKRTVEKVGKLDFIVIDRRTLEAAPEAFSDTDIEILNCMAKELQLMILFFVHDKDRAMNLSRFTNTFGVMCGMSFDTSQTFDELLEKYKFTREKFKEIEAKALKKNQKNH